MQFYANLLIIFYILSETSLYQDPLFLGLTATYFILRWIFNVTKLYLIEINKKKTIVDNEKYLESLKIEPKVKVKKSRNTGPSELFNCKAVEELVVDIPVINNKPLKIKEMTRKEKKQQEEYMSKLKSKLS